MLCKTGFFFRETKKDFNVVSFSCLSLFSLAQVSWNSFFFIAYKIFGRKILNFEGFAKNSCLDLFRSKLTMRSWVQFTSSFYDDEILRSALSDLIWINEGNWYRFSFPTFVGIETLRFWAVSNLLLILHSAFFFFSPSLILFTWKFFFCCCFAISSNSLLLNRWKI